MSASVEERVNLFACHEDYPALYSGVSQSNSARSFAKRLMRKIRTGIKLSTIDWKWKNMYDNLVAGNDDFEDEEKEESEEKKDAYLILLEKMATITENCEKRIAKIQEDCNKKLAEKDARIDDIIAKQSQQRESDFSKLVGMIAQASKDGANSANQHLTTAFTATNSLNNTLLSTMQTQWQNVGNMSKKHFEELNKILENKEKDEPGFFEMFVTEVIIPNQDRIMNSINKLSTSLLPTQ